MIVSNTAYYFVLETVLEKRKFLAYLSNEFKRYHLIDDGLSQDKLKQKAYLNGLMQAARFFGLSFDELQKVIDIEQQIALKTSTTSSVNVKPDYEIPAFIRNQT